MLRLYLAAMIVAVVLPGDIALAQSDAGTRGGKRALLAPAHEIALARSAAPREVSANATIYVLTDTGYAVAVAGTNGNACHVNRSWPESVEPHCFDREGAETVMAIELFRMARVQQGVAGAEIDRAIADGLRDGRFRLPRRPAMSYMMSGAQQLIGDDGKPAGRWQPHIMLYVPYMTGEELGLGNTPNPAAAIVVDPGKPLANIMVVVKNFIVPEGTAPGTP